MRVAGGILLLLLIIVALSGQSCTQVEVDRLINLSNITVLPNSIDEDLDLVINDFDQCFRTPYKEKVNKKGCGCSQLNIDDNNECTLDNCFAGTITRTLLNGIMNEYVQCPEDECIDGEFYNYTESNFSLCQNGEEKKHVCSFTKKRSSLCYRQIDYGKYSGGGDNKVVTTTQSAPTTTTSTTTNSNTTTTSAVSSSTTSDSSTTTSDSSTTSSDSSSTTSDSSTTTSDSSTTSSDSSSTTSDSSTTTSDSSTTSSDSTTTQETTTTIATTTQDSTTSVPGTTSTTI